MPQKSGQPQGRRQTPLGARGARRLLAGRPVRGLQRVARSMGWNLQPAWKYDLLARGYYSPVPDLELLAPDAFERRSAMAGITFDTAAQLRFLQRELAPHVAELEHLAGTAPALPVRNGNFEAGDIEVAYAMVRHLRSRHVLELGSGYSTLALARAAARNRSEGIDTRLVSHDPHPRDLPMSVDCEGAELRRQPAQDIALKEFRALGAGDVMFVDTSHVVRLGGEVNYVVLEVLPVLAPGVVVHFHDIWLPQEYHRQLVELGAHFTEQYLVQAFLCANAGYEVLLAMHAVVTEHAPGVRRVIPSLAEDLFPTSLWLRRTDAAID